MTIVYKSDWSVITILYAPTKISKKCVSVCVCVCVYFNTSVIIMRYFSEELVNRIRLAYLPLDYY